MNGRGVKQLVTVWPFSFVPDFVLVVSDLYCANARLLSGREYSKAIQQKKNRKPDSERPAPRCKVKNSFQRGVNASLDTSAHTDLTSPNPETLRPPRCDASGEDQVIPLR